MKIILTADLKNYQIGRKILTYKQCKGKGEEVDICGERFFFVFKY